MAHSFSKKIAVRILWDIMRGAFMEIIKRIRDFTREIPENY